MGKHNYKNDRITVSWDSVACIHAAECIKSLDKVFDTGKRPWINVDAATNDEIIIAIGKCPSGALEYSEEKGSKVHEESDDLKKGNIPNVTITVAKNSGLRVSGNIRLEDAEGNLIETKEKFTLCRCGASQNKPFCDGTHKSIGFEG